MAHNTPYTEHAGLHIDTQLYRFINEEVLPGINIDTDQCWQGFAQLVENLTPRNRALLHKRVSLQNQIDEWHQNNDYELDAYRQFLTDIGYLVEEGENFSISTNNVDREIANIAGPQLVVPVNNARYALNAANGRWGSLYDAIYGSDMLREEYPGVDGRYDSARGNAVVAYVQTFLDQHIPLKNAQHAEVTQYAIVDGLLQAKTANGSSQLADNTQLVGLTGNATQPSKLLFKHNGLHIELVIDREHLIGKDSPAGICDVQLESALTVIQDCEDSIAAVDAEDKVLVYRNWLGLMKGDLSTTVHKAGKSFERTLQQDRQYQSPTGGAVTLKGRALILVRNVGHLMTNPAILDSNGDEVFEGLMDAMFTSLIAINDLQGNSPLKNSTEGSVYIVKPKMHGPEEVAFAVDTFSQVEQALGLAENTLKIGLMDEEKRTTVNLKACIRQAKERLIFINTGFLDRTGDEIHTAMLAGPVVRKADMKAQAWIQAYENWNVDIGLACGLSGKAQIGKGMWPMPDEMNAMVSQKIGHPQSGANCAWVPSPTAATLHAMHYHQVDVWAEQETIRQREKAQLDDLLTLPLASGGWNAEDIQQELDNNCQGILGYVVRWVDQGVGCSKVPDINNIGLMEDRATLRISSQHIANWLYHGVVTEKQVMESLRRMAKVVDEQNANDSDYHSMAADYQGYAFASAQQLIFRGREVINGYTEPMLHAMRRQLKHVDYAEYQVNRPVMRLV